MPPPLCIHNPVHSGITWVPTCTLLVALFHRHAIFWSQINYNWKKNMFQWFLCFILYSFVYRLFTLPTQEELLGWVEARTRNQKKRDTTSLHSIINKYQIWPYLLLFPLDFIKGINYVTGWAGTKQWIKKSMQP